MPRYLMCDLEKNKLKPKAIVVASTPAAAFGAYLKHYKIKTHDGMAALHLSRAYAFQKRHMTLQVKYKPDLPTIWSEGTKKRIERLRSKLRAQVSHGLWAD